MRLIPSLFAVFALFLSCGPCPGERLTPEKLWDLARVGDAAVSPDGTLLAYLVTRYDLEANEGTTSLMLQPLGSESPAGGKTSTAFETPLAAPQAKTLLKDVKGLGSLGWLHHSSGSKLVYIAPAASEAEENGDRKEDAEKDGDEEDEKKPQAWMLDPSGGEPTQLTRVKEGVGNLIPSPAGDAIAFTVDVKMDPRSRRALLRPSQGGRADH